MRLWFICFIAIIVIIIVVVVINIGRWEYFFGVAFDFNFDLYWSLCSIIVVIVIVLIIWGDLRLWVIHFRRNRPVIIMYFTIIIVVKVSYFGWELKRFYCTFVIWFNRKNYSIYFTIIITITIIKYFRDFKVDFTYNYSSSSINVITIEFEFSFCVVEFIAAFTVIVVTTVGVVAVVWDRFILFQILRRSWNGSFVVAVDGFIGKRCWFCCSP